jgi:hypothetical protein
MLSFIDLTLLPKPRQQDEFHATGPLAIAWSPERTTEQDSNPFLKGREARWEKVVAARPLLCVFGHYHPSYGTEKVVWRDVAEKGTPISRNEILTNKNGIYDVTALVQGMDSGRVRECGVDDWVRYLDEDAKQTCGYEAEDLAAVCRLRSYNSHKRLVSWIGIEYVH